MIRPLSRITTALPARPSYRAALESTPTRTTKKKTIHYTYLSTLTRTTIESVTSSSRRLVREETKGREIALGSIIIIIIINAMLCSAATDAYSRRTAEEYKLHSSGAEEEEEKT